ncbi:MAG: flagellar basal-body rod protein FlgG [Phycisphaerales bacterium]|nr:MAG: flagellar basal-body rod protein FlgG [Phycisphaerales bacterium]
MAIIALHSGATGLSALSTSLDVIANNLANVNTDGFKSSRTNFQDLLYQEKAQPGTENANGDQRPTGLYVGLGTKVSGTQQNFEDQGPAKSTGRELDLMIDGDGFFQVIVEDDIGEGIAYTRAGNFILNSEGEIVLATDMGRRLEPSITIPENATAISIAADGTVMVGIPGQTDVQEVGTIELATFINPAGLKQIGENLYIPSAASGDPVTGNPREEGRGSIRQGFLESSNVDPTIELINLIKTQRAFEFNSQSIQAADEALQTIGRLRRF